MQAIIFAYDVTRRETFESLSNIWLNEVDEFSTIQSAIKMVVANKVDRDSEREVSRQEGATFARQHGCLFVETSAKFNTAVTQVRLCGAAACELWCQSSCGPRVRSGWAFLGKSWPQCSDTPIAQGGTAPTSRPMSAGV